MPYQCRKCGKETLWLRHKETNKPAPIESEPSVNGNVFISGELYRMATKEEIEKAKTIGKPLYLNHFATCEFAKSFSKKEAAKPIQPPPVCADCGLEMTLIENGTLWFCSMGCSKQETGEKK